MSTPSIIFALLPGPDPIGPDMKYDPIFDQLRNILSSEDNSKWMEIRSICIDVLSHRSKDFRIFVRLVDAISFGNLQNLADGLKVYLQALESLWGIAHPKDQQDITIAWLDEALRKQCLKYTAATNTTIGQLYTLMIRKQPIPESTEYNHYLESLPETLTLCNKINDFIAKKDPSLPILSETLKVLQWLTQLPYGSQQTTGINIPALNVMSRYKAYEMIHDASIFLRTHEPHSLAPPLLEMIYQWKDQSLNRVISELRETHPEGLEVVLKWLSKNETLDQ